MTSPDPSTTQPVPEASPGSQPRPGSPVVAVEAASPESAVEDMGRAMDLAGVGEFLVGIYWSTPLDSSPRVTRGLFPSQVAAQDVASIDPDRYSGGIGKAFESLSFTRPESQKQRSVLLG